MNLEKLSIYRSYCSYKDEKEKRKMEILNKFWNFFYSKLPDSPDPDNKKSNTVKYQDEIIRLLHDKKDIFPCYPREQRIYFQLMIEEMSMDYNERNLHKTSPNLLKLLISNDKTTAKEYLKNNLPNEELPLLHNLKAYTLESFIIYVLGLLFSCIKDKPVVRLATLLDRMDYAVRMKALSGDMVAAILDK